MKNIPNILTFLNFNCTYSHFFFFLEGVISNWIVAALFVTASVTDFFTIILLELMLNQI